VTFGFVEAKDVVPAVEPVVFVRERSASDKAKVLVAHIKIKNTLEDQQRSFLLDQSAGPASPDRAVEFSRIDRNGFVQWALFSAGALTTSTEHGAW